MSIESPPREERRAKAVEEGAEAYMDSMMKAVGKGGKTEVDDEASYRMTHVVAEHYLLTPNSNRISSIK